MTLSCCVTKRIVAVAVPDTIVSDVALPGLVPPAFRSTGPTGHRARMRARLLGAGADSLADYEILEMLLFLGIPRRDTKPLAKAMINRYGSLDGVLRTDRETVAVDFDLAPDCLDILGLPRIAAARLAEAEPRETLTLGDWTQLGAYLDRSATQIEPGQWRMLYLDNRNRLLADEAVLPGSRALVGRAVLARALALHATALIALHVEARAGAASLQEAAALSAELGRASTLLSVVLHDTMVGCGGGWTSLRQRGML